MRIGIYGGAFNPIHFGHLRTAEEVLEKFSLDKVVFIPSGRTPFDKPNLAKANHRLEMVKKAIKGNRHFAVSSIEIKSRQKSYTVDTVKKHQRLYPDSELFLILGIDAFLDLPYWKQPLRLINLLNFIVMSRPGYTFSDLYAFPYLKGTTKKVLKELDKGEIMEFSSDISLTTRLYLRKVTGLGIASSHIRSMVKCSENIKYLLPDSVKSYIISNKLYIQHNSIQATCD